MNPLRERSPPGWPKPRRPSALPGTLTETVLAHAPTGSTIWSGFVPQGSTYPHARLLLLMRCTRARPRRARWPNVRPVPYAFPTCMSSRSTKPSAWDVPSYVVLGVTGCPSAALTDHPSLAAAARYGPRSPRWAASSVRQRSVGAPTGPHSAFLFLHLLFFTQR